MELESFNKLDMKSLLSVTLALLNLSLLAAASDSMQVLEIRGVSRPSYGRCLAERARFRESMQRAGIFLRSELECVPEGPGPYAHRIQARGVLENTSNQLVSGEGSLYMSLAFCEQERLALVRSYKANGPVIDSFCVEIPTDSDQVSYQPRIVALNPTLIPN